MAAEAQVVEENEFARATARARDSFESPSEAESLLKTLLAAEEARVAEAIAFAEILVPMLVKRLSHLAPAPRVSAAAAFATRERKPVQDENHGIADFIDDMLAQERKGAH
jgi:hypothetical protein